jgi:polar amino acid transport system permease protein
MSTVRKKGIKPLDVAVIAGLAAFAAWVAWRAHANLDYDWSWGVITQYLLRHDEEKGWVLGLLSRGLLATIRIAVWTMILALVLGTVAGMMRSGRSLFGRLTGKAYVECVRNTPPIVLVFLFYFFIGDQIMTAIGVDRIVRDLPGPVQDFMGVFLAEPRYFAGFVSAVMTLALYEGAYITEIVRSGIQSIEKGQREAAQSLGLSRAQTMRHIILPQALRRILPPLAGQFISTVKDSSIVSVISIQELTFQGMELMAATYMTFEIWITVVALYLLVTMTLSVFSRKLETRLARTGA